MTNNSVTEAQLKTALLPITAEVANIRDDIDALHKEFSEVKKIVTGNGSGVGLDEQARNNRKDINFIYKVAMWIMSPFIISIIALIWGMITHQVSLNFP